MKINFSSFYIFIFTFICSVMSAHAFNDSFMGKSEDFVFSKMGKPDRIVEIAPGVTRFIYGETRQGAKVWAEYYITEAYLTTFKDGKVVNITVSFEGFIDNDGVPKGFPRLKKYITKTLKNIKPVVKNEGKWSVVEWNGAKYSYWAKCVNKDLAYNKSNKGFYLIDINHIEDYYLVVYDITEKNYYREIYGTSMAEKEEEDRVRKKREIAEQKKERAEKEKRLKEKFSFFNLTVLDKETKLMWTRNANIEEKEIDFADAVKLVENLNKRKYGGYSDWRLSSKEELETLVNFAKEQGYNENIHNFLNIGFKNVQANFYWSSNTDDLGDAWNVDMHTGNTGFYSKDNYYYVWPVRAGQ